MLIVNADDYGASRSTTDPVLECFAAGAITSTSAMVFMPDSERAAQLARAHDLPVGLHLNLTLAYGADEVPEEIRRRQLPLTEMFGPESWRAGEDHPAAGPLIAAAIADQLQRFREQFGEPTHIDGHHHVHVHPAVLTQLPRMYPIRPPIGPFRGRPFSQRWLLRRFSGPGVCLALTHVHPALGGEGLQLLEPARTNILEVMAHPTQAAELAALRSPEWLGRLAELPVGSYRDLAA